MSRLPRGVSAGAGIRELVREDAYVDAFRRANKAKHRIAEEAVPPGIASTVPYENLRDAFLTREINDAGDCIVAFQYFRRGSRFLRRIEILSYRDSLSFGTARLTDVYRVEFALKTLLVTLSAFDHRRSIGMRRHADEKALMSSKHWRNAMRMNVRFELRINHFRRQQQSELTQFRELALLRIANPAGSELFSLPP